MWGEEKPLRFVGDDASVDLTETELLLDNGGQGAKRIELANVERIELRPATATDRGR